MKSRFFNLKTISLMLVAGTLALAGCQTPQQTQPASPPPSNETVPVRDLRGYGPSYTTFERDGLTYVRGSMAFPTGVKETSSILLEKVVPQEVMVGQPFSYELIVRNLTDASLRDIEIYDEVTGNFNPSSSSPAADGMEGNMAMWKIDSLGPRDSRTIRVNGSSAEEGRIELCGWLTFVPELCESIRVVRADLELIKDGPSVVTVCDDIPMSFVVRNTGSSRLTNVRISDPLPNGLRTVDGQASVSFDVGVLDPGQSRSFDAVVRASGPGVYENTATASSAQNVTAQDMHSVRVTAPELMISCEAPDERFIGRPINVCYMISNTGDGVSPNTVLRVPIPTGTVFQGATSGGRVEGTDVVWNLGSVAAGAEREVCVTFTAREAARHTFTGTVSASCGDSASTSCSTVATGIPAILLEVVDISDPIEVGSTTVYQVTVTNQGSAPGTNIRVVCDMEAAQAFVSATGATAIADSSTRSVEFMPVRSLAPGAQAVWNVTVRAVEAGDVRFTTTMESDQIDRNVRETESTFQY